MKQSDLPPGYQLDKRQIRRAFSRAAASYDEAAVLQREVGERLAMRLDYIRIKPDTILDLGAGSGASLPHLQSRFRRARVFAVDFSETMLRYALRRGSWLKRPRVICSDARHLPFRDQSIDLVFSNLMLQWCRPEEDYLAEVRRVLRGGGLFLFSTFGPDTLRELRQAFQAVDDRPRIHDFADMHDIGDLLLTTGFREPVVNMEMFTLTYADVQAVLRDLKAVGATNAAAARTRGLSGRAALRNLEHAYETFRTADGRLPLSYEVIYGAAWAGDAPPPSRLPVSPDFSQGRVAGLLKVE